jgi:hypothetical protein
MSKLIIPNFLFDGEGSKLSNLMENSNNYG